MISLNLHYCQLSRNLVDFSLHHR